MPRRAKAGKASDRRLVRVSLLQEISKAAIRNALRPFGLVRRVIDDPSDKNVVFVEFYTEKAARDCIKNRLELLDQLIGVGKHIFTPNNYKNAPLLNLTEAELANQCLRRSFLRDHPNITNKIMHNWLELRKELFSNKPEGVAYQVNGLLGGKEISRFGNALREIHFGRNTKLCMKNLCTQLEKCKIEQIALKFDAGSVCCDFSNNAIILAPKLISLTLTRANFEKNRFLRALLERATSLKELIVERAASDYFPMEVFSKMKQLVILIMPHITLHVYGVLQKLPLLKILMIKKIINSSVHPPISTFHTADFHHLLLGLFLSEMDDGDYEEFVTLYPMLPLLYSFRTNSKFFLYLNEDLRIPFSRPFPAFCKKYFCDQQPTAADQYVGEENKGLFVDREEMQGGSDSSTRCCERGPSSRIVMTIGTDRIHIPRSKGPSEAQ